MREFKTTKGILDLDDARIVHYHLEHGLNRPVSAELRMYVGESTVLEFSGKEAIDIANAIHGPSPLSFDQLRKTNLARCEESFHNMDEWSLNDWLVALGGEVGEAMNYAKKLRRLEGSKPGVRAKMSREELLVAIKKEFGDILTYLDLSATKLGFRLEDCVRDKFNEVSDDIGSTRKL